jgi:GT2 family glycosyltransferase
MTRFSIVTPVHDPPLYLLEACLASIAAQTFGDFELCLVDDGSASPAVRASLRRAVAADHRVRLIERPAAGGIVAASNDAVAMARGEFVALVDHDDRLDPRALALIDDALRTDPDIDYVYTDEDKLAGDGTVYDTFYKPDWSPERLRSQNYCTHLSVLRRALVEDVGRFRPGFDGSQDHDLILRVTERARRVHHVPEVLYHWCITPGSAAGDPDAKPYAREAGRRAVAEHTERVGIPATVEHLATPGHYRVRRTRPKPAPSVSIVIPTVGTARPVWGVARPLVLGAVRSLLGVTEYPHVEVVVVLDPDTPAAVIDALGALDVRLVEGDGPFNYSARCNMGVAASSGELVVLLNDDTLVEQPDWLDVMLGFFHEPDVGVVGARLLYADGTLQHGGILLNTQPLHIFHGFAGDDPGVFGLLEIDREVSAVTGACLATPRALYDELGGLPEEFAVAFNDLDYCLRVRRTGRRIIWTPHATLYHFESQTRAPYAEQPEIDLVYRRWGDELVHDPYGNPHFAPKQAVWLPAERATTIAALRAAWHRRLRRRAPPK